MVDHPFSEEPDLFLDATGLFCPEPVMLLHAKVRELVSGQLLLIAATDPSTERDIAKFCRFLGHELVDQRISDGRYFFLLRKGA